MSYKIFEAKIEFKNDQIDRITVLVEMSKNDVRAIVGTAKPRPGYMFIHPAAEVSAELLQEVAGYGCETDDRDKIFPGWKSKYL